jgi:signal transduction histidine kinase
VSVDKSGWHKSADGSVFWASFNVSRLSNGSFDGYGVISHDTTAAKQYERMLERQNDRLKEFTDILSHDLKSPLSVMSGRLSLYKQTGDEAHLETIDDTLTRMGTLVEDLLSVARQGQVVTDPAPTDIQSVINVAREGTLSASVTFEYQPVPDVMTDKDRLIQVFENLFRNSVDHGGEAVTVRVGPLRDGFYVEDDGPGIPEDDRERVFDHGYTTREEGTGYGLSVVQSVVGAHGWDVGVTDSDDGGVRFEITGIEFVSDN